MANIYNFKNAKSRGYSSDLVVDLFGSDNPKLVMVGSRLRDINFWDDQLNKYTDEISHHAVMVGMEGVEPFLVKLPVFDSKTNKRIELGDIKFLDLVEFKNLEAFENRNQVYFRAEDIRKVVD